MFEETPATIEQACSHRRLLLLVFHVSMTFARTNCSGLRHECVQSRRTLVHIDQGLSPAHSSRTRAEVCFFLSPSNPLSQRCHFQHLSRFYDHQPGSAAFSNVSSVHLQSGFICAAPFTDHLDVRRYYRAIVDKFLSTSPCTVEVIPMRSYVFRTVAAVF